MKKAGRADSLKLSWEEIGFVCEGMALASRPMGLATKSITEEYSLGPRGAWMTVLITTGQIFPLHLAEVFKIGRSLITAELTRLADAGLITYEKNASDGRRLELKLTPLGDTVQRRVKEELSKLVLHRLAAYKRKDVMLCAQMLRDFRIPPSETPASPARKSTTKPRRQPPKRPTPTPPARKSKQTT